MDAVLLLTVVVRAVIDADNALSAFALVAASDEIEATFPFTVDVRESILADNAESAVVLAAVSDVTDAEIAVMRLSVFSTQPVPFQ